MGFIKDLARRRAIRRNSSSVRTGIEPLSNISRVKIFLDAAGQDCVSCITAINAYFKPKGIETDIYVLSFGEQVISEGTIKATFYHKRDINWYGRISTGKRTIQMEESEDMFLSLIPDDIFAVELAARSSNARFKAGRFQKKGNLYDLVVTDRDGVTATQSIAFTQITEILDKIN